MFEPRVIQRFWTYVEKGPRNACWPWKGPRLPPPREYGYFGMRRGERFYAHRVACFIEHGPFGSELNACHSCDNPPCCNGRHTFPGTQADNMQDCVRKGRHLTPFGTFDVSRENSPVAKLTAASAEEIRALRSSGLKLEEIAAIIGVGKSTVSRVINRDPKGGWT